MCFKEEGAAKGVKCCLGRKEHQPKKSCDVDNIFKHQSNVCACCALQIVPPGVFLPALNQWCVLLQKEAGMPSRTRKSVLSFDLHAHQAFSSPSETVVLEAKHSWGAKSFPHSTGSFSGNLKSMERHSAQTCRQDGGCEKGVVVILWEMGGGEEEGRAGCQP